MTQEVYPTGEPRAWRDALSYITSPTMGLPGGADAYEYALECPEHMARMALQICIRQARAAFEAHPDPARRGPGDLEVDAEFRQRWKSRLRESLPNDVTDEQFDALVADLDKIGADFVANTRDTAECLCATYGQRYCTLHCDELRPPG